MCVLPLLHQLLIFPFPVTIDVFDRSGGMGRGGKNKPRSKGGPVRVKVTPNRDHKGRRYKWDNLVKSLLASW